jgi:hypothetical protein
MVWTEHPRGRCPVLETQLFLFSVKDLFYDLERKERCHFEKFREGFFEVFLEDTTFERVFAVRSRSRS